MGHKKTVTTRSVPGRALKYVGLMLLSRSHTPLIFSKQSKYRK